MLSTTEIVRAVHGNRAWCCPPIDLSVEVNFDHCPDAMSYRRYDSEASTELGDIVRRMYGATDCAALCAGITAVNAVALLTKGNLVVFEDCYFEVRDAAHLLHTPVFVSDKEYFQYALKRGDVVIVDSLSNPALNRHDIDSITDYAHKRGAKVAVDNCMLSILNYNPFDHGADYVIDSGTKWMNGTGDAMCGFLLANEKLNHRNCFTVATHPIDASITLRNLPTFPMRMRQYMSSANKLNEWFRSAGLATLFDTECPMIALTLGDHKFNEAVVDRLKVLARIGTFGLNISTATAYSIPRGTIKEPFHNIIRISVGLEDPQDLIDDFKQAIRGALESGIGRPLRSVHV